MGFMQPVILQSWWYKIETSDGDWYIDFESVGRGGAQIPMQMDRDAGNGADKERLLPFTECRDVSEVYGWEVLKDKFGARLSANGYMDCTDWTVHDTLQEARDYLRDTYGEEI